MSETGPAEVRAVLLDEWGGELRVDRVPRPDPGPGEVRVSIEACAVTRTIENAVRGGLSDGPSLTPRIPGHEFAGTVEAVGDGVETHAVGDRVLAYFYLVCDTWSVTTATTAAGASRTGVRRSTGGSASTSRSSRRCGARTSTR